MMGFLLLALRIVAPDGATRQTLPAALPRDNQAAADPIAVFKRRRAKISP